MSSVESTKESLIFDEDFTASDEKRFVSSSDEELVVSDEESVASDLSYVIDVNSCIWLQDFVYKIHLLMHLYNFLISIQNIMINYCLQDFKLDGSL